MKIFVRVVLALLVLAIGLLVINYSKIQRLLRVNSVFDADKIVYNFSHMDEAFFSMNLPQKGKAHKWKQDLQPLPEQIDINGKSQSLKAFMEETDTTALLVIKNGKILFEDYYLGTQQDDLRISWSVAKSFLSAIFGIAVEEGLVESLNDPVDKYVPRLKGSAYEGVTIRNVLNMSSGVLFDEDYLDKNSDINKMGRILALGGSMDEFAAEMNVREREPGTGRHYVSIDTHVIGMVLRAATGMPASDYFQDKLWSKLGVGSDGIYLTDGNEVAFVLGGLNMRTRDYALFGQLFLQNGRWKGQQIIPKNWVKESTKASSPPDVDGSGFDYGYQWWIPKGSHGDFLAAGIYSQFIYVDPKTRTVIVKNSADREFKDPSPSGNGYKLDTVDMFRSIAEHYAE